MEHGHSFGSFNGNLTSGLDHKNTLALQTINFVCQQLPAWRDDPDRFNEKSENRLNLQLCKFLESHARKNFPMVRFDHEEYQPKRRSVDLSASFAEPMCIETRLYTIYDPIVVFESKRLPAPSQDRHREYVTGEGKKISGGIQRFKLGLHGANLDIAAMIGYIQERSKQEWHSDINMWISELTTCALKDTCIWSNNEQLEFIEENVTKSVASYRSVHHRTGSKSSNEIEIYHQMGERICSYP